MGLLRFLLALSVLIGHSDHALGLPGLDTTVAVRSFYILSGFYMTLVLNGKYRGISYAGFLGSRYLRLFPCYLAVLVLTLAYGCLVWRIRGTIEWPLQGWARALPSLGDASILVFAAANLFIVGLDAVGFVSVGPGGGLRLSLDPGGGAPGFSGLVFISPAWTLGLELLFYALAPFIVRQRPWRIGALLLASLALRFVVFPALGQPSAPFGDRFFPFELAFFLAGALACHAYFRLKPLRLPPGFTMAGLLVLFAVPANPLLDVAPWVRYLVLTACLPPVFLLCRKNRVDRFVGELSYPMYIVHLPVFYAVTQFSTWPTETVGSALAILAALGLLLVVELPADARRITWVRAGCPLPRKKLFLAAGLAVMVLTLPFGLKRVLLWRRAATSLPLASHDFLPAQPPMVVLGGFDGPRPMDDGTVSRWGLGPRSEIIFRLPRAANFHARFAYASLTSGQTVQVFFGNRLLETIPSPAGEPVYRDYLLPAAAGSNTLRFEYTSWNGKAAAPIPGDPRPLAVNFTNLSLRPETAGQARAAMP